MQSSEGSDSSQEIHPKKNTSLSESNAGPLPDAEMVGQAGAVLDSFRTAYQAKYGELPAIPSSSIPSITNVIKDRVRSFGAQKVTDLIQHFFSMPTDSWFLKDGHTIGAFLRHVEAINASLSVAKLSNKPKQSSGNFYNPMVVFETQCPQCKGWYSITCRGTEMEKHAYTTHCAKCQALIQ